MSPARRVRSDACVVEPGSTNLCTIGHGTLSAEAFVALLRRVGAVVDVRRFPGSRRHPHVAAEAMRRWLPAAGIAYRRVPLAVTEAARRVGDLVRYDRLTQGVLLDDGEAARDADRPCSP